ncbi:MAG TPA: sigma-70 family RNA polymerase sigma factor [Magnetospirillaceae bacterium]|jgi:RNA polymerase sigma-70 factor (ECF subfamily)
MTKMTKQNKQNLPADGAPAPHHKAPLRNDSHSVEAENQFRDELVGCLSQLRSVARAMTRSQDAAEDLVQETAARALAAYEQFEPGTNLRGWLTTILRNQYISDLRKRHLMVADDDLADTLATPASQIDAIELAEVTAAMETLSERHREVLMLVAIAEMDQEEAAHRCHCAVGTIKSRLSRARSELHAALAH